MPSAVIVHGLTELQRDMNRLGADLADDLRDELKRVAEPVRGEAERLAYEEISGLAGSRWGQMRVGVTSKLVYVAPASRRRGGSPRPNLGGLLMGEAMEPALKKWEPLIVGRVEKMIDRLADLHGF